MKTKTVFTEDYVLLLDLETDIRKGEYIKDEFELRKARWDIDKCFKQPKVISYLKLNPEAPNLDLPLLPSWQFDVEDKLKSTIRTVYCQGQSIDAFNTAWSLWWGLMDSFFKVGLINTLQELSKDKQFTSQNLKEYLIFYSKNNSAIEDELFYKKADELGRDLSDKEYQDILYKAEEVVREKFIQQFQQSKLPKEFIPEFETHTVDNSSDFSYPLAVTEYTQTTYAKIKTIDTPQGKRLVGRWIFQN